MDYITRSSFATFNTVKWLRYLLVICALWQLKPVQGQTAWYLADLLFQTMYNWEEGGVEMKYSAIGNKHEVFYGARGGWQATDNFLFGYGGYVSGTVFNGTPVGYHVDMSYGGITLEFQRPVDERLSFNFPILIGGGGAWLNGTDFPDEGPYSTGFFVAEPGASISMKVAPFLKMEASGTYRFCVGSKMPAARDAQLSAPAFGMALIFGDFY